MDRIQNRGSSYHLKQQGPRNLVEDNAGQI
jgi:hypothetical protein